MPLIKQPSLCPQEHCLPRNITVSQCGASWMPREGTQTMRGDIASPQCWEQALMLLHKIFIPGRIAVNPSDQMKYIPVLSEAL